MGAWGGGLVFTHPHLLPPQDWQEIVSLYEKENTYLGEAAPEGALWRGSMGGFQSPNWDEDGACRGRGQDARGCQVPPWLGKQPRWLRYPAHLLGVWPRLSAPVSPRPVQPSSPASWCAASATSSRRCGSRSAGASRRSRTVCAARRNASWEQRSCGSASAPPASSTASP